MRTLHKLLATGTLLTAALALMGADKVQQQQKSPPAPATRPAAVPATQPASVPLYAGQKPDEWASYQAMHAYILDRFVRSEGFGMSRMPRVEDLPRQKRIYADGTRYFVGRVELISLNDGKKPFAYVTKYGDALKNQIKRAEHAPLDDAAASALDQLKAGKEVVMTRNGDAREFIGAVRATSTCIKCHTVAEGTLLGAFRYPLVKERTAQRQQAPR